MAKLSSDDPGDSIIYVSQAEFEKLSALIKNNVGKDPYPDNCRCGKKAGHLGWSECFHKALDELEA